MILAQQRNYELKRKEFSTTAEMSNENGKTH
jgi:hypothetical protein